MPNMMRVLSSHVIDIGYDEDTQDFHVRYAPTAKEPRGPLAVFAGVDPETAARVMSAPSIGAALHSDVRGKFEVSYPEREAD